jgi:hypothetical protein
VSQEKSPENRPATPAGSEDVASEGPAASRKKSVTPVVPEPPAEAAATGGTGSGDRRAAPDEDAPGTKDEEAIPGLGKALVVVLVGAIVFLLAQVIAFRYGRDQAIYAMVAEAMLRGGAPYRDAWDFKPPGIFFTYALARGLFGHGEHGVRVLEALGFASVAGAFAVLSRRWVGSWQAGLAGALVAIGTHAQLEFWHTGQPESFGAVALAWALVCVTYSSPDRRRQHAAWVAAGALYTAAALLKPPLGGGFVVSLLVVCHERWRRDRSLRSLLAPTLTFAAGGASILGLVALYFAAKGALADLHQTLFVFTPYYTKLSFRPEWFWGFVYLAFEQWVVGYSAFIAAGLGLFMLLPPLSDRERPAAIHVMGVVGFQLIGVGLQAKFFPYHYGAALPFAGLLAGWGFWKLWIRARRSLPAVAAVASFLYILGDSRGATRDLEDTFWTRCKLRLTALREPELRDQTNDHLYSVADVNAGANRLVAEWLRAHTSRDSQVYIWGFEPEIYDLAERRPASRYVYNVPQRVSWATETRQLLMRELEASKPEIIIVTHHDVFPAVTGSRLDSADSLRDFRELDDLVRDAYWRVNTIEDFDIYQRRPR